LAAGRARLTPWPAQGRREDGRRWSLALWVLSPMTVLYTATSADAVFAVALAGAALAAHRGLVRRSWAWTLTGGALLWVGSMLTYAAVLLLVFLLVRAAGRLGREPGWVLRWAAGTAGTVLGLAGLLWLTTGYDPVASVRAVHAAYQAAPGSASRPYLPWLVGDPIAFGGMLGIPLFAALAARAAAVVRQRAWTCFDAAMLACLLAASSWGFSRGEVERIFLFLVPLALVPVGWLGRARPAATPGSTSGEHDPSGSGRAHRSLPILRAAHQAAGRRRPRSPHTPVGR
jgi:hypothetical protein